jgi:transglutaminase-like putative cysteine protease
MHLSNRRQPASKLTYSLRAIPDGKAGIAATLRIMRDMARQYRKSPRVIEKARSLVARLPPKNWGAEVRAIHAYVRDHIRYVMDPRDVETVAAPDATLEIGQGDCDDQATLVAALLEALGHPTRFVAIGFEPGVLDHVYAETMIGPRWYTVETTESVEVGWVPRGVREKMIVNV